MNNRISRRTMIQSAAALPAVAASAVPPLPKVKLGKFEITRLIIGSNPFNGFAYSLPSLEQHMKEWATAENVAATLRRAEENGINTHQFSYHPGAIEKFQRFQREGGKLQWLILGGGAMKEDFSLIPGVAKLTPMAIVHHGGVTDQRFRDGQHAKVQEFLKRVRDIGVMVGMSSHRPENIAYAEDHGWDIDFYMTCFYQLSRPREEVKKLVGEMEVGTTFLEGDPARMCRVIQATKKTCLAFKILAAGRVAEKEGGVEDAYRFAFQNIKPNDAVIVGMYPRFTDEVKKNADIVRRLLTT